MTPAAISFRNDYSEGAHPAILEALSRDNTRQEPGYGDDGPSQRAAELIRLSCQTPHAEVHLVSGGTQANLVVCAALLKPFESIIAAETGHICVHETGAIEATGHKIHQLPHHNGKISSDQIRELVQKHVDEHMVRPRLVYLSQSTELGTIYSREELTSISQACRELQLYLFMDGARIGSALTSEASDLSLADIAQLVDALYIGGTKNGALFGEAIVLCSPHAFPLFRHHLKQRGALLAKSRTLGAQFEALFTDGLFMTLARHANRMAMSLAAGIQELGFQFAYEPLTNQIFPIFPKHVITELSKSFSFYVWSPHDSDSDVVRLVTSWATIEPSAEAFVTRLRSLVGARS